MEVGITSNFQPPTACCINANALYLFEGDTFPFCFAFLEFQRIIKYRNHAGHVDIERNERTDWLLITAFTFSIRNSNGVSFGGSGSHATSFDGHFLSNDYGVREAISCLLQHRTKRLKQSLRFTVSLLKCSLKFCEFHQSETVNQRLLSLFAFQTLSEHSEPEKWFTSYTQSTSSYQIVVNFIS